MKTYNELINERIKEPYRSRIKFYSQNQGTLYYFADEDDSNGGFEFILNLFDFQKTSEGCDFWYQLLENSTDQLLIDINLN
jgi:hypothetical protein